MKVIHYIRTFILITLLAMQSLMPAERFHMVPATRKVVGAYFTRLKHGVNYYFKGTHATPEDKATVQRTALAFALAIIAAGSMGGYWQWSKILTDAETKKVMLAIRTPNAESVESEIEILEKQGKRIPFKELLTITLKELYDIQNARKNAQKNQLIFSSTGKLIKELSEKQKSKKQKIRPFSRNKKKETNNPNASFSSLVTAHSHISETQESQLDLLKNKETELETITSFLIRKTDPVFAYKIYLPQKLKKRTLDAKTLKAIGII